MTCIDAELLLAAHAVGGLDPGDENGLRAHLSGCPACRRLGGVLVHVGRMLGETLTPVAPPPSLRRELMAQVHREAARHDAIAPDPVRPRPRLWRRVPIGHPLTIGGGLAAAAASLLAAWSIASPHGAGAVAVHLPACGSASNRVTGCALDYTPAQRTGVLSIAGLATFPDLGSTEARTYEVWVIPHSGPPVPSAFLEQRPDGRGWSAAIDGDLHGVIAVAVTSEPLGGSPTPTGPEVLRVPLPPGI